ncbi:CoA-binding protein [Desulfococcus sp.]|uniref:CoA-binding protein n=1 Tax=Desulfococcus sp. TaxID=2025834 RepID=UPI0035933471
MKKGEILTDQRKILSVLQEARTIAVLGLSPKPDRDSYRVARYLQDEGYRILPIRPAQKEILGEKAYNGLEEIDEPVDIVDAFRSSDQIMAHVPGVIRLRPRVFWMQLGIEHPGAAGMLMDAGIDVVMNRCIKVEHENLFRKKIIV